MGSCLASIVKKLMPPYFRHSLIYVELTLQSLTVNPTLALVNHYGFIHHTQSVIVALIVWED